jgi:Epoxide hydrolase N terminus
LPPTVTRRSVLGGLPVATTTVLLSAIPANETRGQSMANSDLQPFHINVPAEVLSGIQDRLGSAHFPPTSGGAGWRYGVDAEWFRRLVDYWRAGYDWRKAEAELNLVPQFRVKIDGKDIHFARVAPADAARVRWPILLLHGWPYSFGTMLPLAAELAIRGFESIVPSLPGYGFSPAPDEQVRGLRFIAGRINRLMTDVLGYDQYLIHGGDHGAVVADWLAIDAQSLYCAVSKVSFRRWGRPARGRNGAIKRLRPTALLV